MTSKSNQKTYALIAIFALVLVCFVGIPGYMNPIISVGDTGTPTLPGGEVADPSTLQTVTKPVKIVGTDELAGGALDGTTSAIAVYDSNGQTLLETLSFSSGSCTSSNSYASGTTLYVKYYYDTTIDAYYWEKVIVPKMTPGDADSLTTNSINLRCREAGAYSDSLMTSSGLTLTDGVDVNTTGTSNDTLTCTYTWFTTSDNTGYETFYDPIYGVDMKIQLWASLSGTGYETISLSGFDGSFPKGSTQYYYETLNADAVSKQKIGNDYVLSGSNSFTFGVNAAGFGNTTTSYPTLQLYLKIYSNEGYMQTYGDYGPYDFTAAESTVNFMDIS